MVYTSVPMVMTMSVAACTAPAVFGVSKRPSTRLNKSFPTRPPIAAPIASGVAVLKSICEAPEMRERKTEYAVMDKTVQPERKLMVETGNAPSASRTGLMMTPPPMPQIAPMIDEKKQTANTAMYTSVIPYLRDAQVNISHKIEQ